MLASPWLPVLIAAVIGLFAGVVGGLLTAYSFRRTCCIVFTPSPACYKQDALRTRRQAKDRGGALGGPWSKMSSRPGSNPMMQTFAEMLQGMGHGFRMLQGEQRRGIETRSVL